MWPAGSQTHGSRAGGRSWRTTSAAQGLSASSPRPICTGSSWRSSRRASRPRTYAWLSCAVVRLSGPILLAALLLLALCAASCGPSRRYSTTSHRGLDRVGPLEIDYEPAPPPHTTRADLLRAIATVLGAHTIDFAWSPPLGPFACTGTSLQAPTPPAACLMGEGASTPQARLSVWLGTLETSTTS